MPEVSLEIVEQDASGYQSCFFLRLVVFWLALQVDSARYRIKKDFVVIRVVKCRREGAMR